MYNHGTKRKGGGVMALIKCPECEREISDKAVSCPGCGCPVENGVLDNELDNKSDYERIIEDMYKKYMSGDNTTSKQRGNAIKEVCRKTGVSSSKARDDLYIRAYGKTYPEMRAEKKIRDKIKKRERRDNFYEWCEKTSTNSRTARCPKCHSTSISYQDKISVGRAVVGGTVAGGTGAVLGGLTGKKGYAVCLKCGKRWKI